MNEESILKSLTVRRDGILQNLDGLSKCGKIFFYSFVHLLENPPGHEIFKHQNALHTFNVLSKNSHISISKFEFLDILGNFIESNGSKFFSHAGSKTFF